jgi:hypothetical protein
MRGKRWIAAGIAALTLATAMPVEAARKKSRYTAPSFSSSTLSSAIEPVPTVPYNSLLTADAPLMTTLEQYWPAAQPTVSVEGIDDIIEHYRRIFTVVRSDQFLISDKQFRPIAVFTLPKDSKRYKEWLAAEHKGDDGLQRRIMQGAAKEFKNDIEKLLKRNGLKREDVNTNVGMADDLVKGLYRYAEYRPYLESIFVAHRMDPLFARDAINESNMLVLDVSKADCYGIYQIGDDEANALGMIIPPKRTPRKYKLSMVDERFHPLLNAEAAATILLGYSLDSGSLPDGIEAYHSGLGNKAKMRLLALKYPDPQVQKPKDILSVIEKYARAKEFDFKDNTLSYSIDVVAEADPLDENHSLSHLAYRIRHSNIPQNKSSYKEESRRYLPAFFAQLSAVQAIPEVPLYNAEIVPVIYNADDASYETSYARHNKDGKPYKIKKGARTRKTQTYITGADVAKLFPDMAAYKKHNPHIPLDARIPQKARVDLLPGMVPEFFKRFPELAPASPVSYIDGKISGLRVPAFTQADEEFIRSVTNPRFEGKYHAVPVQTLESLKQQFAEAYQQDPSPYRAFMKRVVAIDHEMYTDKRNFPYFKEFLAASARAHEGSSGTR